MASELLFLLMMAAFLAAVVAAWALLPLFVMALFKRSRPSAGRGITAVSWVGGGALWTTSAIAIQTGLGATDLLMGLGLTAAAALGATAAGWRTRGMLASLLPMGVFMLLRQSDFINASCISGCCGSRRFSHCTSWGRGPRSRRLEATTPTLPANLQLAANGASIILQKLDGASALRLKLGVDGQDSGRGCSINWVGVGFSYDHRG